MAQENQIGILGASVTTPLGLNAKLSFANYESGINRFQEIKWRNQIFQPFVMSCIPEKCFYPLVKEIEQDLKISRRGQHLLKIATTGIEEIQALLPEEQAIPLFLGLPEDQLAQEIVPISFLKALALQAGLTLDLEKSELFFKGRAAGLVALHEACSKLEEGIIDFALVGGCDSYYEYDVLRELDFQGRAISEKNRDSFIPAEGAGFLLLARRKTFAQDKKLQCLAIIEKTSIGAEIGHFYSDEDYLGEGLHRCLQRLFSPEKKQESPQIQMVFSSMNGESYWVREWDVAWMRHHSQFDPQARMFRSIDRFGDVGAAIGPINLNLVLQSFEREPKLNNALLYASSDWGTRAALIISRND